MAAGPVLGAGDTAVNKTGKEYLLGCAECVQRGQTDNTPRQPVAAMGGDEHGRAERRGCAEGGRLLRQVCGQEAPHPKQAPAGSDESSRLRGEPERGYVEVGGPHL